MSQLKKFFFMLNKMRVDLKTPRVRYSIADEIHKVKLDEYYFLFEEKRVAAGKDQALINKFDEKGIPINKTYIDVTDKDYVYFPISIGQMGLSIFHTYLRSKSDDDKARFMNFVDWFFENAELSDNLGARWMTDVSLPAYKNPGPWQSAFSQSRGISILLRGYQLTGDIKYAEMAEKALKPFTIDVKDGGVTQFTQWGPFYEEYTSVVPTLVLNGMIFSICGIYDFVRVFPDNVLARELYENGIQTIINILPDYDLGFWSRYNLCNADWYPKIDPATIGYQYLHITQLRMLYKLTQNNTFIEYANRFEKQTGLINILKMYKLKYKSLKQIGRL
jgi:heparosan-N-sulfate-glucuronate 5-epimerase